MKLSAQLTLAIGSFTLATLMLPGVTQANTTLYGTSQNLGQGNAATYVVLDDQGQVTEIGITLSESALTNLPTEETELDLALPQVAIDTTPFTHVSLNWNPEGHLPTPIYGTPHFDVHFFTIAPTTRQAITVTGDNIAQTYKTPDSQLIPAGYQLAPDSGVPREGAHWINPQSPEFQGEPHGFDHTFIYGFYDGTIDFLEPMVSKATLEQYPTIDEPIPQPDRHSTPGLYPTHYSITYEAQTHQYRISLNHLQHND